MKTLRIVKGEYMQSYRITDAFSLPSENIEESAITDQEFAHMSQSDYEQRLQNFVAFVYASEPGLSSDCPSIKSGSVVQDLESCPVTIQS